MQTIKPSLGLLASPLGIVKSNAFNRFLLRKSNFQLGLNQPLGAKLAVTLHNMAPLVNHSKLLLSRQEQAVTDETIWNQDWDFDGLKKNNTNVLYDPLETEILHSPEEQTPDDKNYFNPEHIITIITDSLPSTTLTDISFIHSTEDNYYNQTSIHDINQDTIPSKKTTKTNKSSKKPKNKKSNKNTNTVQKKPKPTVTNTAPENQHLFNEKNSPLQLLQAGEPLQSTASLTPLLPEEASKLTPPSLINNSFGELGYLNNMESQNNNFQLEAKNVLQDEYLISSPQVDINLKEISNQESILYAQVNTNYDIHEIEASQETKNIIELDEDFSIIDSQNQEKPVITQLTSPINPKTLEDNSVFKNLENFQDISENTSEVIKQPIQEHEEIKQERTENKEITSQPIYREVSSVESTEVINTLDSTVESEHTENFINDIPLKQNINLELPITETVINHAPPIQHNTQTNTYTPSDLNTSSLTFPLTKEKQEFDVQRQDEAITTDITLDKINTQENIFEESQNISSVEDLTIQKLHLDNLEKNYQIPTNSSENVDIESIPTNLINTLEVLPNQKLLPGANLDTDTTVIQNSVQHHNAHQATDEIDSININNINVYTQTIDNTLNINVVDGKNDNLVIEETPNEQVLPKVSKKVDNLETENLIKITDSITNSKNILPKISSENVANDLSSNLFNNLQNQDLQAPTGYATGGLVVPTNISDNPTIAPSDTVPAMLTPGEFIINVKDAQKNIDILRHINSGGTLPEDITTPNKASTETTEQNGANEKLNSFQPSTKVDIQTSLSNIISPQLTDSEMRSPGIKAPNPLQFNLFDNSTENSNHNLTAQITNHSNQYSSPPLIFRQANTSNTGIPSQWSSVEELLNLRQDSTNEYSEEFTLFSFGQTSSTTPDLDYPLDSKNSQAPTVSTKRLPAVQGFAEGGEVTESDIATDIEPITETIQSPANSNTFDSAKQENNENDSLDIETLAREIYNRLRQRLEIERERYGIYSGRLPW
ncbi:MAG: hypothetical protein IGS39_09230 [Calothrix sp. C42_A2020_038]|nr:hypothetical protein [Calothrix sp. C42_A2020_038]